MEKKAAADGFGCLKSNSNRAGTSNHQVILYLKFAQICYTIPCACRCVGMVDEADSKICSPHAVRNLKAFEIQGFPETKNPPKPAPTSKSTSKPQIAFKPLSRKHLCRRDGIGRRVGLKIQWANHPCGFDPRRRHHPEVPKALFLLGFRDFYFSFSGQPFLRPEP